MGDLYQVCSQVSKLGEGKIQFLRGKDFCLFYRFKTIFLGTTKCGGPCRWKPPPAWLRAWFTFMSLASYNHWWQVTKQRFSHCRCYAVRRSNPEPFALQSKPNATFRWLIHVFLRKMLGTRYGPVGTRFSLILETRFSILGPESGPWNALKTDYYQLTNKHWMLKRCVVAAQHKCSAQWPRHPPLRCFLSLSRDATCAGWSYFICGNVLNANESPFHAPDIFRKSAPRVFFVLFRGRLLRTFRGLYLNIARSKTRSEMDQRGKIFVRFWESTRLRARPGGNW